jgi:hypothetical protein
VGKLDHTVASKPCIEWMAERSLVNGDFPDRDVIAAGSYCRNFATKFKRDKPWCYHIRRSKETAGKRYDFCNITECRMYLLHLQFAFVQFCCMLVINQPSVAYAK